MNIFFVSCLFLSSYVVSVNEGSRRGAKDFVDSPISSRYPKRPFQKVESTLKLTEDELTRNEQLPRKSKSKIKGSYKKKLAKKQYIIITFIIISICAAVACGLGIAYFTIKKSKQQSINQPSSTSSEQVLSLKRNLQSTFESGDIENIPRPPHRPPYFKNREELKNYLQKMHKYYRNTNIFKYQRYTQNLTS